MLFVLETRGDKIIVTTVLSEADCSMSLHLTDCCYAVALATVSSHRVLWFQFRSIFINVLWLCWKTEVNANALNSRGGLRCGVQFQFQMRVMRKCFCPVKAETY